MSIVLGPNQYGKAENRVVRVYRDTARHEIRDLNVSTVPARRLHRGPRRPATRPASCPPTRRRTPRSPSPRSTASPPPRTTPSPSADRFLERHARRDRRPGSRSRSTPGTASTVGGTGHDHAFVQRGGEVRTTVVTRDRQRRAAPRPGWSRASRTSSSSSPPARSSRASSRTSTRRCRRPTTASSPPRSSPAGATRRTEGVDWNKSFDDIREVLLETFATTYSRALQESLYAMGSSRARGAPRGRRDQVLGPQQAPLPGRPRRRSGWRTPARCSSPPTGPTA